MSKVVITPFVADALERSRIDGDKLYLPSKQLERAKYLEVNKVLEALGGKWNKKQKAHNFPAPVGNLIAEALDNGFALKNPLEQFYTSDALADYAVSRLALRPGMTVLEPSAGRGALIRAVKRACPFLTITAIDCDPLMSSYLENFRCTDFLEWVKTEGHFDAVVMNPPFRQDARHLLAAWEHTNQLVAICSASITFRETELSRAVRSLVSQYGRIEHLPEKSFAPQTDVQTALVVLKR